MSDSKHAAIRMQQRGISRQKVDLILQHGVRVHVTGGAYQCMVPRGQINDEIFHHRRQIQLLESLKDTSIILDEHGDLITVQHHTRRRRSS